jgi:hypothetical protein
MRKVILGLAIAVVALGSAGLAKADADDDRAAAKQIADNMKQSGRLKNYSVGVKYQNGVAYLSGTVTSPQQKIAAEQIARQSDGVDRIVSKLEVSGGSKGADQGLQQQAGGYDNGELQTASAAMPVQQSMPAPQRRVQQAGNGNMPLPYARTMQPNVQQAGYGCPPGGDMGQMGGGQMAGGMGPQPMGHVPTAVGASVAYDNPQMPGYAWPSYAAYPNYAALTYPKQYSAAAWPYIGPFYPYPQVPLGWRKVTLEWDDGWWFLDFKDCKDCH